MTTVAALRARDFPAQYFARRQFLVDELLQSIPPNARVGIGGSVTIRELGLIEILEKRGNRVIHHWQAGLTEETDAAIRREENGAEYYLSSANAITTEGDIINIDGVGNRVAAMIYGPKNVIIIAGYNKIVGSIEDGVRRSREIAATMNARRVNAKTACAETGICTDCRATSRICRVITIMQYRPWQTAVSVRLVNEDLGF